MICIVPCSVQAERGADCIYPAEVYIELHTAVLVCRVVCRYSVAEQYLLLLVYREYGQIRLVLQKVVICVILDIIYALEGVETSCSSYSRCLSYPGNR